jgi:hypothetical protein
MAYVGIGIVLGLIGIGLGLARALGRSARPVTSAGEMLILYSVAAGAAAIALAVAVMNETGLVLTIEMKWSIVGLAGSGALAAILEMATRKAGPAPAAGKR